MFGEEDGKGTEAAYNNTLGVGFTRPGLLVFLMTTFKLKHYLVHLVGFEGTSSKVSSPRCVCVCVYA